MKDNLSAFGIFIGFFLLAFSDLIIPKTLLNDYLIYSIIIIVGLIASVIYISKNTVKIIDNMEYFYIPIRSTLCIGALSVFSFL